MLLLHPLVLADFEDILPALLRAVQKILNGQLLRIFQEILSFLLLLIGLLCFRPVGDLVHKGFYGTKKPLGFRRLLLVKFLPINLNIGHLIFWLLLVRTICEIFLVSTHLVPIACVRASPLAHVHKVLT